MSAKHQGLGSTAVNIQLLGSILRQLLRSTSQRKLTKVDPADSVEVLLAVPPCHHTRNGDSN